MSHDELVEYLERWTGSAMLTIYIKALRAVVELHKPTDYWIGNIPICSVCEITKDEDHDYSSKVSYPCPTIQAIEKELK